MQVRPMQFLNRKGHCYDVTLSYDNEYLFYSNALGVVIYQRTQPNFNKNFPSMFNAFQSFVIPKPHHSVPWQIKVRNEFSRGNGVIAYVAYDFDGVVVYNFTDIDRAYVISEFNGVDQEEVARLYLSQRNENMIYVADSYNSFFAADISDLKNPVIFNANVSNVVAGADFDDIKPVNALENVFITAIGMRGAALFEFKQDSTG